MEERVFLQWTVANWLTVFLMATLGYLLVGAVAQAAKNMAVKNGGGN